MNRHPIRLKNVKVHNLKGVDLTLNPSKLTVFTGVSGSGKSSLAFDTIYVEGQRRYVESLSTYARRYMGNLKKPEADLIEGISPTIAIEQKTAGKNPRSTVGTMTGIYDYLRILFARIGIAHCPISNERVTPQSSSHILSIIESMPVNSPLIIFSPFIKGKKGEFKQLFDDLLRKGFMKARISGTIVDLSDEVSIKKNKAHDIDLVIDRVTLVKENHARLKEAVITGLELGEGSISIFNAKTQEETFFSEHAYAKKSKISYPPLNPQDFSFNHPTGMCPNCQGLGTAQTFDITQVIDPSLSISENCCKIAGSYHTVKWGNIYNNLAELYNFSVHTPWEKLSKQAQNIFLYGNKKKWTRMLFSHPEKNMCWTEYIQWRGVFGEAKKRFSEAKSESYHKKMKALMHEEVCQTCLGARIKPYPAATLVGNQTIHSMTRLPLNTLHTFIKNLKLSSFELKIAEELISELHKRIEFLLRVGLSYLTLDRSAPTLSGGEAQRVRLAAQIGSGLVGATYILDEPSIGLHPVDNTKLIETLKELQTRGNTIIVVEHDQEMIEAADHIVDIGPGAGFEGGCVVAEGTLSSIKKNKHSLTGHYLSGKKRIEVPVNRRKPTEKMLTIVGATHHNLKNITATIPLGLFVAVTGVSGSGKSSLIADTLYPALARSLHRSEQEVGKHQKIEGVELLDKVIEIDQSPIGRTPRSNPSTYIKVFDAIRDLFAKLPESILNGFKPGRFSFNVEEGSCTACKGMGAKRIDMDFLEDVWTECPLCLGKRFDPKTLSILYKGKNIHDVLEMTVREALSFFESIPPIHDKLMMLMDVGLDYLTLGQPSTTLSGGEAQRIKLSKEMVRKATGKTLYILDEPSTGLHFDDIQKLLKILHHLVNAGNTVLVIEHNMDIVKTADWVLDLGPEGGEGGGEILSSGEPETLATLGTPTGKALNTLLKPKARSKKQPCKHRNLPITHITAKGCSQNNLKQVSLSIPLGAINIFTGPSGSGKTSFAFETLYAEGQRRYIESLSSFARQFVKQMPKPKAELIEGLCPAIAIEQKRHAGNPRSTVGTMTEVYDFLRLLYARLGIAYCPETGEKIEEVSKESTVQHLMSFKEGSRLHLLAPFDPEQGQAFTEVKEALLKRGFLRIRLNGTYYSLEEDIPYKEELNNALFIVVDRIVLKKGVEKRLFEAVEQILKITSKPFTVQVDEKDIFFNLAFSVPSTGKSYPKLTPQSFSFNSQEGMCPSCLGLGFLWGANLTLFPKVMALTPLALIEKICKEEITRETKKLFTSFFKDYSIDPKTPLYKLAKEKLEILLNGLPSGSFLKKNGLSLRFSGVHSALAKAGKMGKAPIKESLTPLLKKTPCPECKGARINALARAVKLNGKTIGELCNMPIDRLHKCIKTLNILPAQKNVLEETLFQLNNRLQFLVEIGLNYLSIDRSAPTLSGGETQRIHLARQLGSGLTGCLYVLDEPTIGLHPHNNARLNEALKSLRDLGNTLNIVEHDPQTLQIADRLFEFGPGAGSQGGKLIAEGTVADIKKNNNSLTGLYLSGKKTISIPEKRRKYKTTFSITNANTHNLKNVKITIPIGVLTCVTGVSGSGKSTLISMILKEGVQGHLATRSKEDSATYLGATISGLKQFNKLITIDQNPIGHTIRANVSTYSELLTPMRQFFSSLPEAKARGLQPKHFSMNHKKGMCKACWGLGFKSIDLQFLSPIKVTCDTCHGNRLNPLSLSIKYLGKNLGEYLKLTVEEISQTFPPIPKLIKNLDALRSVGLGYLTLGQEIATLSGGEAARMRLARELSKRGTGKTLYLFDEPTIGLHFEDIATLIPIFQALVNKGNTVIIIEHNLDIMKVADHIIDLGPGPGAQGGYLVSEGTPEKVAKCQNSLTAKYLTSILSPDKI